MKRITTIASAFLLLGVARDGAAQVFLEGFAGTTVTSPSKSGSASKAGFGGAFGNVGKILGFESELAYYPELLDNANSLAKNKVITFSGNTLIGPTIGGRVKPYGAFGLGDLHLNATSAASVSVPNPSSVSNDYFTINVGGGVMGFFLKHLGVRGDLRYYRAFGFKIEDIQGAQVQLTKFDFWRAGAGLVLKF